MGEIRGLIGDYEYVDALRDFSERAFRYRMRDRAGGDPGEWPEDLRVREWPGGVG